MSKLNSLYDLIRADGSIVINKNLCHALGVNETIIYSELLSRHSYFEIREELDQEGYFFNTVNDLQLATCIGEKPQKKAINKLKELGLIDYKLKGVPPKRYFKIIDNIEILVNLLELGRKRIKELQEKQGQSIDKSKLRLLGGIKTAHLEDSKPSFGRVNNTNINNTNKIIPNNRGYCSNNRTMSFDEFLSVLGKEQYDSEKVDTINYLLDKQLNVIGKVNNKFTFNTWDKIYSNWFIIKTDTNDIEASYDDMVTMIDSFFDTKFKNKNCNYSIILFDKCKATRYYDCGLL